MCGLSVERREVVLFLQAEVCRLSASGTRSEGVAGGSVEGVLVLEGACMIGRVITMVEMTSEVTS